MKAAMQSAGCWPSASITSAWVKPAAAASLQPGQHRGALAAVARQRAAGGTAGRRCIAARSSASLPSVLPSITTQTGAQAARAARTVSSSVAPVL